MHPDHRSIGELAFRLWQSRGCPAGTAEHDWLEAERQLANEVRLDETQPPPSNETSPASIPSSREGSARTRTLRSNRSG